MLAAILSIALLAAPPLAGVSRSRKGATAPSEGGPAAAAVTTPDRVMLYAANDAAYHELAIPKTYKTDPDAPNHLLVFRGGLCIRDVGLKDTRQGGDSSSTGNVVEESGTTERAFVAPDGGTAMIARTRYLSRVDLSPEHNAAEDDIVTGDTTVTFVDPAHPDGRWRITLEQSRWLKDAVVLGGARGVVLSTFRPRTGPADTRVLDAAGRERLRVPESYGQTLSIGAAPDGTCVAADVAFRNDAGHERGVMVFDLSDRSQWIYGWRYGDDAEPVSWKLLNRGILAVTLPGGTRRFDAHGRKI